MYTYDCGHGNMNCVLLCISYPENIAIFVARNQDHSNVIYDYYHLQNLSNWNYLHTYRVSSNSFRGNYSFVNLEIVANSNSCGTISIFYLINLIFAAETIQEQKL